MEQELREAANDGIATLTLNRPARLNALSAAILDGLLEALPRLETDPAIGVIVLTGAGRAFCSGGFAHRCRVPFCRVLGAAGGYLSLV